MKNKEENWVINKYESQLKMEISNRWLNAQKSCLINYASFRKFWIMHIADGKFEGFFKVRKSKSQDWILKLKQIIAESF